MKNDYKMEVVFEKVFGDDAINRYTFEELLLMLDEMYDCYKWVVEFGSEKQVRDDLKSIGAI